MEHPDYPTVRELLAMPVFAHSRLLCGEAALDRPVVGVNLADIPDYQNWIFPHELVVSNCFAIHKDPAAIANYIQTLARHGLSGACIKPTRFLGIMPEVMLHAAEGLNFPLIELPDDVRFADITKAVSDERLRRQTALLRSSLSVNQMLIQTITAGASLEQIADTVCEITGSSVLLVDSINQRQAHSLSKKDAFRFSSMGTDELRHALQEDATAHEMNIDGHMFGILYLCEAEDRSPIGSEILSQILRAIPLEISREHSVRQRESRSFSEFFLHLISDRILDDQWEQARASAFCLNLAQPHVLLGVHIELREKSGNYAAIFQRTAFFQSLQRQLEELRLNTHSISQADSNFMLLSAEEGGQPFADILTRFPSLFEQLCADFPALVIAGGCSRPHAGIPGLSLCNWEAQLALKAALNTGGNRFLPFDQLGILRLLYSGDPHREIGLFIHETLKGLTSQNPHSAELLQTLDCYFKNLGNQRRMAQELHIHYNTVAYRLKGIQDMTGMDLDHPPDRLQLELALYLRRFHTL